MLLQLCIPVVYLFISIFIFSLALHCHNQTHRYYFLPFFVLFTSLSLTSSTHLAWIPGLTSLWTQAMVLNILHIISLLYIRQWPAPHPPATSPPLSLPGRISHQFKTTYRLWGNPQLIGVDPESNTASTKKAPHPISVFLFLRLVKLPMYYYVNVKILPAVLAEVFGEISPDDFAQDKQILLRRLHDISTRELMIRAYASVLWIWQSLVYLDGANAILACFFVGIGLDHPSDWPSLFGNLTSITSLRSFWSRFWHRIAIQPYTCIGKALVRRFNLRTGSYEYKVFIAFVVFAFSGLSHGLVSWQIGRDGRTDVWWFMINFLACSAETVFLQCLSFAPGYSKELQLIRESWFGGLVGRMWVFAFFFWSVPKWQYPAMYRDAVLARQMVVWSLIFSKMTAGTDHG